jgi:two-component system chemotaxis sensor kinase CheA
MVKEEIFEQIEEISIQLVDLDEKEYTELADILKRFDRLRTGIKEWNNTPLNTIITLIYELIEKLILRDIDPISDFDAIYTGIYLNFDNLKKMCGDISRNKIPISGDGFEESTEQYSPADAPVVPIGEPENIDLDSADDDQYATEPSPMEPACVAEPTEEVEYAPEPVVSSPPPPVSPPPAVEQNDDYSSDVLDGDAADDELFMDFVNEAKEYVSTLENLMLDVEQTPGDLNLINEIFRPFHTLKGVSGFMGLNKINHISHEAENILDKARNGKMDITPDHCVLIFKTIDIIKRIINGLNVTNKKENCSREEEQYIVNLLRAANEPGWVYNEDHGGAMPAPAPTPIPTPAPVAVTPAEVATPTPAPTSTEPPQIENPFVEIAKDLKAQASGQAPATPVAQPPADTAEAKAKTPIEDSIRVKIDKLDFLIDMVGELVITYNLFHQDRNILSIFDHEFLKKKSQLQRVISDLQKASMSLRMVPIGQTFTKMKRVIRDYTAQHKKKIDLVMIGDDTEIDRNMVDSLNEPLVHMIRNSCDHGIESAEERLAAGKPANGTITLKAYHKGNTIVIDVKDDGKGLNKEKILAKALSKGLINENAILTDSQIYNLVFLPGFSTVDVVSNVSGRGVGMDVVTQAIKLLGGSVEILSEPGKGSTFRIALPLTLAIIDGMLVKVSGELYIIPIANVRRSLKPEGEILNSVMNKGETVKLEGSLIPIVRLNRKFKFLPQNENLSDCLLIIIQAGDRLFSISVDELIGIQSVVVKTLGDKFKDLDGISGATIMGDGKVGLILDCNKLDVER